MTASANNDQWGWSEMEELLQCPVCFEAPTQGTIEQCRSGHHICSECKPKVENCPLCKCSYMGTRNFVLEELMRNLEILKNSMLLTAIAVQDNGAKVKTKKKKAVTSIVLQKPKVVLPPAAAATKGTYPCPFTSCNSTLPSCRILNHVRSSHFKYFTEGELNENGIFKVTFSLASSSSSPMFKWQRAIFVTGIGLVFFTYTLLKNTFMIVTVQMPAKRAVTQRYKVSIVVKKPRGTDYCHKIKLPSTRDKMENLLYREECLLLANKQVKCLKQQPKAACILEFSFVKPQDRFGSNYTWCETRFFGDILGFYNVHEQNGRAQAALKQVDAAF